MLKCREDIPMFVLFGHTNILTDKQHLNAERGGESFQLETQIDLVSSINRRHSISLLIMACMGLIEIHVVKCDYTWHAVNYDV